MGHQQHARSSYPLARRTFSLGIVAVLVLLVLASSAWAWRPPSAGERHAITAAARRTPHAGASTVRVSNIRVSSAGPWASATVTIYFGSAADSAVDILHRVHGTWKNASVGTAGEWCVMPIKDQRNLGFPASYPCH